MYKSGITMEETVELAEALKTTGNDFVFFNSSEELIRDLFGELNNTEYFQVRTGGNNIDYAMYYKR